MENITNDNFIFCKHCGTKIPSDSMFCENCGKKIIDSEGKTTEPENNENEPFQWSENSAPVASHNSSVPHGATQCHTCGATIVAKSKICPNCGARKAVITPKLRKCGRCGGDVAANAKKCPHCGKISTGQAVSITVCVVLCLFVVFLFAKAIGSSSGNTSKRAAESQKNTTSQTQSANSMIYQDDSLNVEFMKLIDVSAANAVGLQLKITNKGSAALTLMLEDVYVNDIKVSLVTTAVPLKIEPGKISQSPFTLFIGNTNLKADDISKIEFKIMGLDDNSKQAYKSKAITINK